jgi:hypothetical protein
MTPRPAGAKPDAMLVFLRVLVVALALASLSRAAPAAASRQSFELPADSAEKSLKRFAEQAGREVLLASPLVRGVRANAVKGVMSPREAMDRLLLNTGLVAVYDERTGAFSVRKITAEEIQRREKTADASAIDRLVESKKKRLMHPKTMNL